jgi:uncharacterized protein
MRGEDRLLELQEIDSSMARTQARAAALESGAEVQAARTAAERAESRVGELRLAMDALAREQRAFERDIETLEAKRTAEEKRMYDGSIVNQKELEALQHEIATVADRRTSLEDELLRRMERFEELEVEVGEAEGEMAASRTRLDAAGGRASEELARIRAALGELSAGRDRILPEIDPELLHLYEDLRRTKRGVGAAALVDGNCQGCHQAISAVELNRLKHSDGIKRCEHCRRILVFV